MPKVADLSLEEFRALVKQTVRETMLELNNPDAGLELRPEIETLLKEKSAPEDRISIADLAAQYGLKW